MLLFPILLDLNLIVAALLSVPKMPCCTESLGVKACTRLKQWNPITFAKRCATEADFGILQCCHTCRTNVTAIGREIFVNGTRSVQCFDRTSCSEESCKNTMIAFRTCRKYCGYCEPIVYEIDSNIGCPYIG